MSDNNERQVLRRRLKTDSDGAEAISLKSRLIGGRQKHWVAAVFVKLFAKRSSVAYELCIAYNHTYFNRDILLTSYHKKV